MAVDVHEINYIFGFVIFTHIISFSTWVSKLQMRAGKSIYKVMKIVIMNILDLRSTIVGKN